MGTRRKPDGQGASRSSGWQRNTPRLSSTSARSPTVRSTSNPIMSAEASIANSMVPRALRPDTTARSGSAGRRRIVVCDVPQVVARLDQRAVRVLESGGARGLRPDVVREVQVDRGGRVRARTRPNEQALVRLDD